ncbi:TPA: hypothetical protein ACPOVU_000120 [Campylobacter jejuni]
MAIFSFVIFYLQDKLFLNPNSINSMKGIKICKKVK